MIKICFVLIILSLSCTDTSINGDDNDNNKIIVGDGNTIIYEDHHDQPLPDSYESDFNKELLAKKYNKIIEEYKVRKLQVDSLEEDIELIIQKERKGESYYFKINNFIIKKNSLNNFYKDENLQEIYRWKWKHESAKNRNRNKKKEYKEIIEVYEKYGLSKTSKMLAFTFPDNSMKSNDEKLGLIIACYYGTGDFRKAAIEVLNRDKSRKKWNYSMKLDLALCLRQFRLTHTLNEGIALVDSLKRDFNTKIISYFWLVTPIEYTHCIESSFHCGYELDNNTYNELKYLIKTYPDDTFVDIGYYLIEKYEEALEVRPDTRMKDIYLLAAAEQYYNKVIDQYDDIRDYLYHKNYGQFIDIEDLEELRIAAQYFQKYINKFNQQPYVKRSINKLINIFVISQELDTARYYLDKYKHLMTNKEFARRLLCFAEIEQNRNNFEKALLITREVESHAELAGLEHFQFELASEIPQHKKNDSLLLYFINKAPPQPSERRFYSYYSGVYYNNKVYKYYEISYRVSFLTKQPIQEALNLISTTQDSLLKYTLLLNLALEAFKSEKFNNTKRFLDTLSTLNYYMEDEYEVYMIKEKLDLLDNLREINTPEIYQEGVIKLRYDDHIADRPFAYYIVREGIRKFPQNDYLRYLEVRTLVNWKSHLVEPLVDKFLKLFPNSEYADDVLSELVHIQFFIFDEPFKGENNVNKLLKNYPTSNACDDALYWFGLYYWEMYIDSYNRSKSEREVIKEKIKMKFSKALELSSESQYKDEIEEIIFKLNYSPSEY